MKTFTHRALILGALLGACRFHAGAQRSGNTNLVIRVTPEAHLKPSLVTLQFHTLTGGAAGPTGQTEMITAWVRALPGQRIRLTGRLSDFSSPVRWTGTPVAATGGGQAATCTSGTFQDGTPQDLISGWQQSGTLTCAITFSPAETQSLPPGAFTSRVDLNLQAD